MAKLEFLQNLKTARNLFFHRVRTDHPALDAKKIAGQLERAAIWLTPSSVRGFDLRDFPELSAPIRNQLKDNIDRFVQVAKRVPPTKPAEPQEIKEAMTALLKVIEILNPYLPSGGELQKVQEALQRIKYPNFVRNFEFELRTDSTGDPAVWVWVFVDDSAAQREEFTEMGSEVEERIRNALSEAGITRWPYVRFRTPAEQRAL